MRRAVSAVATDDAPQLAYLAVHESFALPGQATDAELRDELESPPRDFDVRPVAAVGIVEIEDSFEGFPDAFAGPFPRVGDVESVGVGGDEVDAFASKGSITFFE
jgi:hypothetical protein